MSLTSRVDGFQRRHPVLGFPLAVFYKYFDDGGGYLAALITYYAFLSIFPLLLLASTILGFVLAGDPEAQEAILRTALSQLPVIGSDLQQRSSLGGGAVGLIVGILVALYGGMGVAMAVQNAMNTAWTVPKNSRPNPVKVRLRALVLLAIVGLAVLGTTALSALGGGAGAIGAPLRVFALVASVVLNAGVFTLAFRLATARRQTLREVAPGALMATVVWQLLQFFGAAYVGHVVNTADATASATNGVFALVLGLFSFLYLASVAVVLCVEVNVVRVNRLWPRALLTPVTDNVELTDGDERAYTDQATAQRRKGFEKIEVHFDK